MIINLDFCTDVYNSAENILRLYTRKLRFEPIDSHQVAAGGTKPHSVRNSIAYTCRKVKERLWIYTTR